MTTPTPTAAKAPRSEEHSGPGAHEPHGVPGDRAHARDSAGADHDGHDHTEHDHSEPDPHEPSSISN